MGPHSRDPNVDANVGLGNVLVHSREHEVWGSLPMSVTPHKTYRLSSQKLRVQVDCLTLCHNPPPVVH
jgi:hypothetical protein